MTALLRMPSSDHQDSCTSCNEGTPALIAEAIRVGEAIASEDGALVVKTGKHTGRAARDKFIVADEETSGHIAWGPGTQPMTPRLFAALRADFDAHLDSLDRTYSQDLFAGASAEDRISVRVITELAWHSLFARTLLIPASDTELVKFAPEYTLVCLPSFKAIPERHGTRTETVVAINFAERMILIGGTAYAGEIKKAVFTVLNYLLPPKGVMPMHCSANIGPEGEAAIFFGLSGTGKTTLSADSTRTLIGDDEHGWNDEGIFNFEGGCYAKTIRLSPEAEPDIYRAASRFGAILENVTINPVTRRVDFDDDAITENTRAAYPLEFIGNAASEKTGPPPTNIVMLTADAFGVLPPIAELSSEQAVYYFLSGYTAKVAGTEMGVTEPEATFSTCFGAPFMPRHATVYGALLKKRMSECNVRCWLLNTGWTEGPFGTGRRMPIAATRRLLAAALDGSLVEAEYRRDANFGFNVPLAVDGVDANLLDPRSTWADPSAYDEAAQKLVGLFTENFQQFERAVDYRVLCAGPGKARA
jgi:phosphoenolpyruvate carboxykinase (ATP)